MDRLVLGGGAFAAFHLARAAWAFAAERANLGTVFDGVTALTVLAAATLVGAGRGRAAAWTAGALLPVKALEVLHAGAHLAAHGFQVAHAAALAVAAGGGALLWIGARAAWRAGSA